MEAKGRKIGGTWQSVSTNDADSMPYHGNCNQKDSSIQVKSSPYTSHLPFRLWIVHFPHSVIVPHSLHFTCARHSVGGFRLAFGLPFRLDKDRQQLLVFDERHLDPTSVSAQATTSGSAVVFLFRVSEE